MQGLRTARETLESALRSYEDMCLTIINCSGYIALNTPQNLSEFMETELELYATFFSKAARGSTLLSKARNSLTSLVPVNSLPDEILLRIFRSVMRKHSYDFQDLVDHNTPPTHSLTISQVCARWRQVSLGSRSLWSNINISTMLRGNLISLGETFAYRSGNSPLNIRIIEPLRGWGPHTRLPATMTGLLSEHGPRAASFEFNLLPPLDAALSTIQLHILKSSLMHLKPGQCVRLTLSDRNNLVHEELHDRYYESSAHWFLFPQTPAVRMNEHSRSVLLEINPNHYEDVLAQIRVLELDGMIYPFWTSKAYHGLVELRLMGPRCLTTIITIQQLANILASSPGLHVLHFGLEVSLMETSPQPVYLADLEVFILRSLRYDTQQAVLKLINPGSKPLCMSTTYNEYLLERLPARFDDEFRRFFRRSNIAELEVHGSEVPAKLSELLQLLPSIQILVLRQIDFEAMHTSDQDNQAAHLCPNLHTLHLRFCSFTLEIFQLMASPQSLRNVTLLACSILPDTGIPYREAEEYRSVLMEICPAVQFLEQEPEFGRERWGQSVIDMSVRIATSGLTNYRLY